MAFYRNLCRFCSRFVWKKNPCGENLCGEKMTNVRSVVMVMAMMIVRIVDNLYPQSELQ